MTGVVALPAAQQQGGGGRTSAVRAAPSSSELFLARVALVDRRIVDMDTKTGQVSIKNPKGGASEPPKTFTFDMVYDWKCVSAPQNAPNTRLCFRPLDPRFTWRRSLNRVAPVSAVASSSTCTTRRRDLLLTA